MTKGSSVRALFDFNAANDAELSFRRGDVILVTRRDVGAGWWEGSRDGVLGLFPRNYVELIEDDSSESDSDPETSAITTTTTTPTSTPTPTTPQQAVVSNASVASGTPATSGASLFYPTFEKSRSPTSWFQRPSSPSFMSETSNSDHSYTIINEEGSWSIFRQVFTVFVINPEKKKKYSGVSTYISYSIKTSVTSDIVSRRFKNFIWLHDRLTEKYPFVVVPSIPEKQVQGRFESEFVEKRMRQLERYLNRIVQHPVLRSSSALHYFLTTSDVKEWKDAKRSAEAEASDVTSYLDRIRIPEARLVDSSHNAEIERFAKFSKSMDRYIEVLKAISENIQSSRQGLPPQQQTSKNPPFKQVESDLHNGYGKMSEAFRHLVIMDEHSTVMDKISEQLVRIKSANEFSLTMNRSGCWCWREECTECAPLSNALIHLSSNLGRMQALHVQEESLTELSADLKEFGAFVRRFKAILKLRDTLLDAYKIAQQKDKEGLTLPALKLRCDKASTLMLAEMQHFHQIRGGTLKKLLLMFVQAQVAYHKRLASTWEELIPDINDIFQAPIE